MIEIRVDLSKQGLVQLVATLEHTRYGQRKAALGVRAFVMRPGHEYLRYCSKQCEKREVFEEGYGHLLKLGPWKESVNLDGSKTKLTDLKKKR